MMKLPRLSLVIPVFRNAESIPSLSDRLQWVTSSLSKDFEVEIILVDDGSDDDSWLRMTSGDLQLSSKVILARLTRNFGQVSALLAGFEIASGECVAFMSADLQDDPTLLIDMAKHWKSGSKVVIAHRAERNENGLRVQSSRMAYWLARLQYPQIPKGGFDYALLDRIVVDQLLLLKGRHRFLQGDITWFGYPTAVIPYTRQPRPHGRSQWTLAKKWKYFVDVVIDGSYLPVKAISRLGMLFSAAGLLYALVIVGIWATGGTPFTGWAPIMILLLVVGGLIMSMIGIMGEYLWRMYDDLGGRPRYVLSERITLGRDVSDR